jgi:hypothetical protein
MARQVSNRRGQAEKLLAVVHLPALPRARVVWGYTGFGTLNGNRLVKHRVDGRDGGFLVDAVS